MTTEMFVVVAFMVGFVVLALWIGDDRVIPCGERQGLDALLGDQAGHVDGPAGGGGCIVPTASAWTAAVIGAVVPFVGWLASIRMRARQRVTADDRRP